MARRDDAEFLEFASAFGPQLRRTAYLLCGDWDRAADVTQETLIRLYVAWPRLDRDAGLRTYARRTVASVVVDMSRRRSSTEAPGATPVDRPVPDQADVVDDRLLLVQALADLPPRQRACVVLRYYADLDVVDVAAALGCRPGTVKSQTARGLDALRESFRRHGGDLVVDNAPEEASTW